MATPVSPRAQKSHKRRGGDISPPPLKRKVVSTTTSMWTSNCKNHSLIRIPGRRLTYNCQGATVANFFKPLSAKDPERVSWRILNKSLLVAKYDNKSIPAYSTPRKVASFDLVRTPPRYWITDEASFHTNPTRIPLSSKLARAELLQSRSPTGCGGTQ